MLRQFLINCDVLAGRHLDLILPAYIEEQILTAGSGVYSSEDWSRTRSQGYRGAGENSRQLDTEAGYRGRLATTQANNVATARRFARTLDFNRYNAILEIGCGEMVHGYMLTEAHPGLRYRATDFDPYVVEKCRALPLLGRLEKGVLDAGKLTPADLAGFKLLVAWEMIYALDDARLQHVLRTARAAGIPFLAGTTQLLGPLRYGWRRLRGSQYERRLRERKIRMHGWNPSTGHYDQVARPAGMRVTQVWAPDAAGAPDNFFYVLFEPDPSLTA